MNLKIKSIDESQKEASNILFVCMSFESIRWKKYLETNNNYEKYDKTVIFYNKEFINLYKEDISAYEKNDKYELIETSISDPLLTIDKYIEIVLKYDNKLIDIDCSTFTHEHLFIFLKVCAHLKHNSKINIIYTSVEDYLLDEDNGWLSKGTKEIRNIIGYSGNLLPSKQLHLIVLVGLENERIQKIIEEYEPNKITIGKATIKSSLNGTVSDLNEKLHNRVDKFVKKVVSNLNDTQQFEFSSNNPEETFEVLNTIINENSNYNNIIVAANSKISTLGVAKLGLLNENIQICYAEPIEYNTEHYTKGCKDFKYFEFIFND